MPFYPKTTDELRDFLENEINPDQARRALAAIFFCLYGTERDGGQISFATEKEWGTAVVCEVADELATIGLYCDQKNRDEV